MTRATQGDDDKVLAALAMAMVKHPRSNLQELARATGISKATLYRFCGTRDLLVERLTQHAVEALSQSIRDAELDHSPPLEALKRLAVHTLENQELMLFLIYYFRPSTPAEKQAEAEWFTALDAFFLRGQQAGVFRIDVSAAAMAELWISMLIGLHDAERRGRVARLGLPVLLESMFLQGAART